MGMGGAGDLMAKLNPSNYQPFLQAFRPPMRKLILKCGFSPGDLVMLTAAIRDLHHWYPGRFVTDVRTACPDIWENNPHITELHDDDSEAEIIDCAYPLINRCNTTPYHCLHGFIEFLNERLDLAIKPTAFKGDLHLSEQEKAWYSQVYEATGENIPFWIVAAGGKYDVTIKWWASERYQGIIDYFRDKIQFVQVGDYGHHHPKLGGVIDLRGQTSLRELIRLVHHSQGVLCSVTALMHLAAAVETKGRLPSNRPCVVIAGGREPAHWEAYPDHQFIHTNGALPCCTNGGCWKDRVTPLRDGNTRDRKDHLCVDVVNKLPRCLDMIQPAEVIHHMETYFNRKDMKYLSPGQRKAAERGIVATSKNPYDQQPLNLHNAGSACERFIQSIPLYPARYQGRGIVICGGGVSYFTNAWVCINMLRSLGCRLPVQVWHLGWKEMDANMEALLAPLGVECINAQTIKKKFPVRILHGWELKPYAILHSSFQEVLLLDADNVPVVNPEFLFDTPQFRDKGAIFWPDYGQCDSSKAAPIWRSCGMRQPNEPEFESGQIVVDKKRCWSALNLCMWFNENSDFYYQFLHGDKETFHLAFRKLKRAYALVQQPIHTLEATMCQHDFRRRRIFQHRNMDKWDLFQRNKHVQDFWFEKECRDFLTHLGLVWDGGLGRVIKDKTKTGTHPKLNAKRLKFEAVIISSVERGKLRRLTLDNLAKTDWGTSALRIHIEDTGAENDAQRQSDCALLALKESLQGNADYILLLEDALNFNHHIYHNLLKWNPIKTGSVTLAGLYNPQVRDLACDLKNNARIVDPNSIFGSQAFLISRTTLEYLVKSWKRADGALDRKIARLACRLKSPIFYHAPSLVQHIATSHMLGRNCHRAIDFDANWHA
jgi:ADP-heptose:LPS heptosyltransferase